MAMKNAKSKGKAIACSDEKGAVFFTDVTQGPNRSEVKFRLIHFWEARNPLNKGSLIGVEILLIDEKGSVVQGFIHPNHLPRYESNLKAGSVYSLLNFFCTKNKAYYRVADQAWTISFSHNSVLTAIEELPIERDRFRLHSYDEFQAACGLRGGLYDLLGHMRVVNDNILGPASVAEVAGARNKRRADIHIQIKDGPVMRLYLWDNAAAEFYRKFTSSQEPPSVIMVTTVDSKHLGGNLALNSMSSSRLFFDHELQETRDYLKWLGRNSDVASQVNPIEVTRVERMTIGQINAYIAEETPKEAFFDCVATVDGVPADGPWYFIACSLHKTKVTMGINSFICAKCGNAKVTVVPRYRAEISVYDDEDQATFVLLGDAGYDVTAQKVSEIIDKYHEANPEFGPTDEVPVPQSLLDCIGKTLTFRVKVTDYNFTGGQNLTVTKVVKPDDVLDPKAAKDPNDAFSGEAGEESVEVIGDGVGEGSSGAGGETNTKKRQRRE